MGEPEDLQRQRVLEHRLRAMGLDAGLLPGGRSVVATLPLGPEPFESIDGARRLRAVRFYSVGHDRIKCVAPRALFHLAPIRITGCERAEQIEERIRAAWVARLRALRDAERWLSGLGVVVDRSAGAPVLAFSLGLDDPGARAQVIERGRLILPSRGPLSGIALREPAERSFEPSAHRGTELAIATTVRLEALARRGRDTDSARAPEIACDFPAPRPAQATPLLLVGRRLAELCPLHESLRLRGFCVQAVASQSAALEAFRARSFGLVVAETRLDRGDGIELIPAVRALPGVLDLPVVLVDERPSELRRAAARTAGASGYLTGAIDASRLGAALAQMTADRKRRRFARYACAVSVSWAGCKAPAITAQIGRGGCMLRGSAHTPPRARYAIHLPELRQSVQVEAETAYRTREGPDWASDGVGLRFAAFEAGAEADWIAYLSALGQAGRTSARPA